MASEKMPTQGVSCNKDRSYRVPHAYQKFNFSEVEAAVVPRESGVPKVIQMISSRGSGLGLSYHCVQRASDGGCKDVVTAGGVPVFYF